MEIRHDINESGANKISDSRRVLITIESEDVARFDIKLYYRPRIIHQICRRMS
jgi:Ni,Fe-hydrogenase III large subunit